MAKKTLLELRTAAREELLEPTAARWTDAQLNRYLNDGQRDLAEVVRDKARVTINVTAGQSSAVLPSTVHAVEEVWWESGGTRSEVVFSNRPFEPDTASLGTPVKAWIEGDTLRFWPAASSDGTLLIKGVPGVAAMVDDTDTHGLPDDPTAEEALVAYCVWHAYLSDFDPQREIWAAKYGLLRARFAQHQAERNPQTATVRNVYDDEEPILLTPWDYL